MDPSSTQSREYRTWINMRSRCNNPKTPYFHHYGGRGIKVCERWEKSFHAFLADMGPRPSGRHSIDRLDVNGDYSPDNCEWRTRSEQGRNKRSNRIVTYKGERMTLVEAVEKVGGKYNTVLYRLIRGASEEDALR